MSLIVRAKNLPPLPEAELYVQLHRLFSFVGKLKKITIITVSSKIRALIEYENSRDHFMCHRALNGLDLQGKKLDLKVYNNVCVPFGVRGELRNLSNDRPNQAPCVIIDANNKPKATKEQDIQNIVKSESSLLFLEAEKPT